jgi:hypothetical protein
MNFKCDCCCYGEEWKLQFWISKDTNLENKQSTKMIKLKKNLKEERRLKRLTEQ